MRQGVIMCVLGFVRTNALLHHGGRRAGRRVVVRAASTSVVKFEPSKIRAISFDVTGTIMVHAEPIMKTYADAASWAQVPNPPSEADLKPAFKAAYKESLLASPCFGGREGLSSRQWWVKTVTRALELCDPPRRYSDAEFSRFFRRVYQHYGSPQGYMKLKDAESFLSWISTEHPHILLGITSNTPARTMETVLPMNGYHDFFKWFVCSQDVGVEKPDPGLFQAALDQARFWVDDLQADEVLHIGDSLESDFCGARAFGFQSLRLDRSENPRVTQYQDWLDAPDYPGKTQEDIDAGTVKDFDTVRKLLSGQLTNH